jgi:hypothetical protein
MFGITFVKKRSHPAQGQAQSAHVRADAIMQFSGDFSPLFVLRVQQPSRQMPQRGLRLIALGDVFARAKRADDRAVVVAQQRVAPPEHSFFARPGEYRIFDLGQISGQKIAEAYSDLFSDSGRDAGLEPVAAQKFALLPAERRASLAVNQRDPALHVQRAQDDVGNVEIELRAIALLADQFVRAIAFGDVPRYGSDALYSRGPMMGKYEMSRSLSPKRGD